MGLPHGIGRATVAAQFVRAARAVAVAAEPDCWMRTPRGSHRRVAACSAAGRRRCGPHPGSGCCTDAKRPACKPSAVPTCRDILPRRPRYARQCRRSKADFARCYAGKQGMDTRGFCSARSHFSPGSIKESAKLGHIVLLSEEKSPIRKEAEAARAEAPGRGQRPYPPVLPKYRNPVRPSEIWAGRGKRPHCVLAQLGSGTRRDDLRIRAFRRANGGG
jgi:hypothetical protein